MREMSSLVRYPQDDYEGVHLHGDCHLCHLGMMCICTTRQLCVGLQNTPVGTITSVSSCADAGLRLSVLQSLSSEHPLS